MRQAQLTAMAVVAALWVLGCGGGDSSSNSNKALSYGAFGEEADSICQSENTKLEAVTSKLTGRASADAPVFDELIPTLQSARDKFKALRPPPQLRADFDAFNATIDQQIDGARAARAAARAGDQAAYRKSLNDLRPLGEQRGLSASRLGAAECTR